MTILYTVTVVPLKFSLLTSVNHFTRSEHMYVSVTGLDFTENYVTDLKLTKYIDKF